MDDDAVFDMYIVVPDVQGATPSLNPTNVAMSFTMVIDLPDNSLSGTAHVLSASPPNSALSAPTTT